MNVDGQATIRKSAVEFHVAGTKKPLASAAKMVEAGNEIVPESGATDVENTATGERTKVKVKDETFVLDVILRQWRSRRNHP